MTVKEAQDDQAKGLRRFVFLFERGHEGIQFADGYVATRGRIIGREPELHGFDDMDELLQELCLSPTAITWIDPPVPHAEGPLRSGQCVRGLLVRYQRWHDLVGSTLAAAIERSEVDAVALLTEDLNKLAERIALLRWILQLSNDDGYQSVSGTSPPGEEPHV